MKLDPGAGLEPASRQSECRILPVRRSWSVSQRARFVRTARWSAHIPEKWAPVFRKGYAPLKKLRSCPFRWNGTRSVLERIEHVGARHHDDERPQGVL